MRAWLHLLSCIAVLTWAAACSDDGGDGGSAGSGATDDRPEDRCRISCETFASCEGFPLSGCAGEIGCSGFPSAAWRSEVAVAFAQCQAACPADQDTCVAAAYAAAGDPRTVDDEFATACDAVNKRCGGLPNNVCGEEPLYPEAVVLEATECLGGPCASVDSCVDGLFQR